MVEDKAVVLEQQEGLRREVDGSAEIPGKDPFEIALAGQRLPEQGILVNANVVKGFEGVVSIYEYGQIGGVQVHDYRPEIDQVIMNVELGASRKLDLAYEHPNSSQRDREPRDRMSVIGNLGLGFARLDIQSLSDGGRLLIQKEPGSAQKLVTSFDREEEHLQPDCPNRKVLRLFDAGDYEGVAGAVETLMAKVIGAQAVDVELISSQVRAKLKAKK